MSAREHRKYVREQMTKVDRSQACFTREGQLESLHDAVLKQEIGADLNKLMVCPFCLRDNKLQKFLVSTKKGVSNSRAQCPACGEGMLLRSLMRDWTPETYAQWVFEYSHSGFWKKVHFEIWKDRLIARGWSDTFWNVYRELKTQNPAAENYEDRMNRMGEEAAQQWNEEGPG